MIRTLRPRCWPINGLLAPSDYAYNTDLISGPLDERVWLARVLAGGAYGRRHHRHHAAQAADVHLEAVQADSAPFPGESVPEVHAAAGGPSHQRGVPEAAQHAVHEIGVVHVHDRDPGQAGQYPDVRSGVLAGQAVEELAARSLFPRPPPDQRDLAVVAAEGDRRKAVVPKHQGVESFGFPLSR